MEKHIIALKPHQGDVYGKKIIKMKKKTHEKGHTRYANYWPQRRKKHHS